jgi:ABC-type bacteriocin/lantibiotic exporter with double-glycine peptidase domain
MPPNLLRVEHIQQATEAGCLLACIQMVTRYLGREVTQHELAALLEAMPEGVPASRVRRLESLGFKVTYRQDVDLDTLLDWLARGIPVIVFLQTDALEYWTVNTDHAVVAIGLTDQTVFVDDPAFSHSPQACSVNAFLYAWSEFENRCAVIQR